MPANANEEQIRLVHALVKKNWDVVYSTLWLNIAQALTENQKVLSCEFAMVVCIMKFKNWNVWQGFFLKVRAKPYKAGGYES